MLEIRFHGRGGQGAKTAAVMLAEAFMKKGMHAQAFPEFGPERRGAPVKSFVRVSKEPITLHEEIKNPDFVVVLDESLAELDEIAEGLKENGTLLVNSAKQEDFFRKKNFKGKVYAIDATKIAVESTGHAIANMAMLGALAALIEIDFNSLKEVVKEYFAEKKDRATAEKNIRAMEIAFRAVK